MTSPTKATRGTATLSYSNEMCLAKPLLRMVGWSHLATVNRRGLPAHIHHKAFEICYLASGTLDWWVGDQIYELTGGSYFVTHPGEVHGAVDAIFQPCDLYWIQIQLPEEGAAPGLTEAQTEELARTFSGLRARIFPGSEDLPALFHALLQEHDIEHSLHAPYCSIAAQAILIRLLTIVLRDYQAYLASATAGGKRYSPRIERVLQWIEEHLTEETTVAEMAQIAGISPSLFHKRFLAEVYLTPNDYRARERVKRAKHLLRNSAEPITMIGIDLGFATSQYFASIFKKMTGTTPREYRRAGPAPISREPVYGD